MRKHVSAASAILAATASFVLAGTAPAQAAAAPAQQAADRALLFLSRAEAADGSVGADAGVTEDTVLGTAAAGHDPNSLLSCSGSSPLGYLATVADAKYSTLGAGALGKLILAVVAGGQNPRAFGKAAQHDLVAQLQTLKATQTFDQSLAVLAEKAAGAPIPASALSALKASQDSDGGWNYTGVKDGAAGSDTNSTAIALEALVAAGDHSADGPALAFLRTQQQADGGYPYQGSGSDPDSTAIVAQALAAEGQDASGPLAYLTSTQDRSSGGFTYPGNPGPDAFTASQVPAGLMLAPLPITPAYAPGSSVPGAGCLSTQGAYQGLPAPARAFDSRKAGGAFAGGETRWISLAGSNGVPASGATAVVLNVTVTDTTGDGFLAAWPAGTARPTASSLNWTAGQTKANQVTVAGAGMVALYNSFGSSDVVVDVAGYFTAPASTGGRLVAQAPQRLLDTRTTGGPLAPGETRPLAVPTSAVPAAASSVILNVTATDTSADGYLTVYPGGSARPGSSSLNWAAGQTVPNRVTVGLGPGGLLDLYNFAGRTDLVVDLDGYYTGGAQAGGALFTPMTPVRAYDTRGAGGPLGSAATLFAMAGKNGVPSTASAVALNVTATDTSGSSWLKLYPSGQGGGTASDLNWVAGQTVANADLVGLGPDGSIGVLNFAGTADVILDVVGYYS